MLVGQNIFVTGARAVSEELPWLCVMGATTLSGSSGAPRRVRIRLTAPPSTHPNLCKLAALELDGDHPFPGGCVAVDASFGPGAGYIFRAW